ncbi:biotin/lipoyl-containing protein [Pediococcus argentinicus]|uniref:acetyl-CoA carboxylase biotin carboxyl carrier protein n=1 Tax=Pediococcus argentinicus TaxID=480391 RepID=UPI00338FEA4F
MDSKEIEHLLGLIEKSSLKKFKMQDGDFKLSVQKQDQKSGSGIEQPTSIPENTNIDVVESENLVEIKAPFVGVSYLAPSEDQPAYKKVGDSVKEGEIVCLIEAMKMFNEVKSPISGFVEEVLVESGQLVEFDQTIMKVRLSK